MRKLASYFVLGWFALFNNVAGQVGGARVYEFLNTSPSARFTALGGTTITIRDDDPFLAFHNPAAVNDSTHKRLALAYNNYIADLNGGSIALGWHLPALANVFAGVQFLDYGSFNETDPFGNRTGNTFSGSETAFIVGVGRSFGAFHLGTSVKFISSTLAYNSALGLGFDFGGQYFSTKRKLCIAFAFRNVGTQIRPFQAGGDEPFPFTLQVGISKKMPKAPLRLSFNLVNLEQWQLIRRDPTARRLFDLAGNPMVDKPSQVDNFFRHAIFGLEILASKYFHLRFAYNHRRRQELKNEGQSLTISGINFGFGFRLNRFLLDYGYGGFHASGGAHHFSISTFLKQHQPPN